MRRGCPRIRRSCTPTSTSSWPACAPGRSGSSVTSAIPLFSMPQQTMCENITCRCNNRREVGNSGVHHAPLFEHPQKTRHRLAVPLPPGSQREGGIGHFPTLDMYLDASHPERAISVVRQEEQIHPRLAHRESLREPEFVILELPVEL